MSALLIMLREPASPQPETRPNRDSTSTIPGHVGQFSPEKTWDLRASQKLLGGRKGLGLRIREFVPGSLSPCMIQILAAPPGVMWTEQSWII